MPPYHTFIGTTLTVYLEVTADADTLLPNPIDNVVGQIAAQWGTIAAANGFTLTVALGPGTANLTGPAPAGVAIVRTPPPAGTEYFNIVTGLGTSANPATRGSRISYVNYGSGQGYIYQMLIAQPPQAMVSSPNFVPAMSHELGHVLGLSDRYYEGAYWLRDHAINRTWLQIRLRQYGLPPNDFRNGVAEGPLPLVLTERPRLAVRASLPMSAIMMNTEGPQGVNNPSPYNPLDNLMSTSTSTLSTYQVSLIRNAQVEPVYRLRNWVAILGEWRRYGTPPSTNLLASMTQKGAFALGGPDFPTPNNYTNDVCCWQFPAWESNPQQRPLDDGTGLLFLPVGDTTPKHYPCIRRLEKGRTGTGTVFQDNTIATMKGKKRVFHPLGGSTLNVTIDLHPLWMRYARQLLRDLLNP